MAFQYSVIQVDDISGLKRYIVDKEGKYHIIKINNLDELDELDVLDCIYFNKGANKIDDIICLVIVRDFSMELINQLIPLSNCKFDCEIQYAARKNDTKLFKLLLDITTINYNKCYLSIIDKIIEHDNLEHLQYLMEKKTMDKEVLDYIREHAKCYRAKNIAEYIEYIHPRPMFMGYYI